MKYYLTYAIDARFIAAVEADNLDEALKKAEDLYGDADFGEIDAIGKEIIMIEDENGDYVYEE